MSSSSSLSMPNEVILCYCGLPSRLRVSRTENNPGRRFRNCPNSMDKNNKCEFWVWIDPPVLVTLKEDVEVVKEELEAVKNELQLVKREYQVVKEVCESFKNQFFGLKTQLDEMEKEIQKNKMWLTVLCVIVTLQLFFHVFLM